MNVVCCQNGVYRESSPGKPPYRGSLKSPLSFQGRFIRLAEPQVIRKLVMAEAVLGILPEANKRTRKLRRQTSVFNSNSDMAILPFLLCVSIL